jgi:DNA-binding response OmpR family regulator
VRRRRDRSAADAAKSPEVALLELDLPELHTLELLNQARDSGTVRPGLCS